MAGELARELWLRLKKAPEILGLSFARNSGLDDGCSLLIHRPTRYCNQKMKPNSKNPPSRVFSKTKFDSDLFRFT